MKLSVVIPVFNEEKTVREIIKKASSVPIETEREIIVVDDGSSDATKRILEAMRRELGFILISHQKNRGKGAAIRTGLSWATGDFILVQDADLEYDPADYPALLAPLLSNKTKIVYGSRRLLKSLHSSRLYTLGGQSLTFIFNLLFTERLTDINTGYKIFAKEVLDKINLEEDDFAFCEEVSCKAKKLGYRIMEVPIHYYPRSFKEGKKIHWLKDGTRALFVIVKYRIRPLRR